MVVVDFGTEKGEIEDWEVGCVDEGEAEEEIEGLVGRAVREIRRWDWEVGTRVGFVLGMLG